MISLKGFEKFPTDGIEISIIRLLSSLGDPWMKEAYKCYKKILMEEIK